MGDILTRRNDDVTSTSPTHHSAGAVTLMPGCLLAHIVWWSLDDTILSQQCSSLVRPLIPDARHKEQPVLHCALVWDLIYLVLIQQTPPATF